MLNHTNQKRHSVATSIACLFEQSGFCHFAHSQHHHFRNRADRLLTAFGIYEPVADPDQEKQTQKMQAFLAKIDNGSVQLNYDIATEDSMLDAMRTWFEISKAEHAVWVNAIELHQALGAEVAFGALIQISAVLIVGKRMRNHAWIQYGD